MSKLSSSIRDRIFHKAVLSRFVEERLLSLFSEGKLFGTVHTCIGQELSGAVLTEFFRKGDTVFSSHRCHGHFLSHTTDVNGLIAELMGKETGVCGGWGGSQHLCKDGFFSNGIQGGTVPVSAGLALAHKLNKAQNLSVVFIGDGTLGEGVVYETLNLVAKWDLPLLIVLEDNGYAQSTAKTETLAGDILNRAESFGIKTGRADTWDWEKLYHVGSEAIDFVREKSRPFFLLIETFRLKAHSKGDDTRPKSFVEPFEQKDPVSNYLKNTNAETAKIVEELSVKINLAVKSAENAQPPKLRRKATESVALEWKAERPQKNRVVRALNETFKDLMKANSQLLMIGEDIKSPYGGAFKVTQDLSDLYPSRVWNTPISEAAIVGLGTGAALAGYRPFVEIMFGDFTGLAFDQIVNHAAKFEDMYNGQVEVNLVVRTPMGGGRGYGPTHSQTLDRHFLGTPGLRILALNNLIEPARLYRPLVKSHCGPTLVIENKLLYGSYMRSEEIEGYEIMVSQGDQPVTWIRPQTQKTDLTLIGYGGMTDALISAAQILFTDHDRIAQVICPTQIYPFDIKSIRDLLVRSQALVVVEEGQGFAGFGAEILAQASETQWRLKTGRVFAEACCIPASGPLEAEVLPNVNKIVQKCLEVLT